MWASKISSGDGPEWTAICNGEIDTLREAAAAAGAQIVEEEVATLDEIFVARVAPLRER